MNFLAHLYLSGTDPKVMVGNFLGDFVKGREALKAFEPSVVTGIVLHRAIDQFTDHHPVVQKSKNRLRPKYRHYSGVIVDMFYDYYLGSSWKKWHPLSLSEFATIAYQTLGDHQGIMPAEARGILPHIIRGNWLVGYASMEGIHHALAGMARRTVHESRMDEAIGELQEFDTDFRNEFEEFFPELVRFSHETLNKE